MITRDKDAEIDALWERIRELEEEIQVVRAEQQEAERNIHARLDDWIKVSLIR